MKGQVPYDAGYRPPAPVLPVGISAPGADPVMVPMLIDTGADITLLPAALVRQLQLPRIDTIVVTGFGGARLASPVHAATFSLGGVAVMARVVAADEALLGRDLLERVVLELDGPRGLLSVKLRRRPAARRSSRAGRGS